MTDKPLIVIVDDDASVREALQALMRSLGYCTKTFSCGDDFLCSQTIAHTRCLIADVQMPGISGPELQARLISSGASVPTVLITAYPNDGDRTRALAAGAIGYLSKPFAEDQLLPYLHAVLGDENGVEATP
jgi:FixJ family two-component response regulator